MALNEFEGTVLLVSHDRALLRAVCDEFWLVGRGVWRHSTAIWTTTSAICSTKPSGCANRRGWHRRPPCAPKQRRPPLPPPQPPQPPPPPPRHPAPAVPRHPAAAATQRKLDAQARQQLADKTRPLNQQLQQIDQRLALLSTERSALEQKLNQALPATEIAACGRRLKAANAETARLEERWLEISAALEEISGATVNGP